MKNGGGARVINRKKGGSGGPRGGQAVEVAQSFWTPETENAKGGNLTLRCFSHATDGCAQRAEEDNPTIKLIINEGGQQEKSIKGEGNTKGKLATMALEGGGLFFFLPM